MVVLSVIFSIFLNLFFWLCVNMQLVKFLDVFSIQGSFGSSVRKQCYIQVQLAPLSLQMKSDYLWYYECKLAKSFANYSDLNSKNTANATI